MTEQASGISQRTAAKIAGFGYLIIIVLALFANLVALQGLVQPGDAAATVRSIAASGQLFRSGIVALMAVLVSDAVVAWALYVFFRRTDRDLSLLAAWFRLLYAAIFGIALLNLLVVVALVAGPDYATGLGAAQRDAQAMLFLDAYDFGWAIGLVCFGIHLLLLGLVIVRSDDVPAWLGILLMFAGLGYLADSLGSFLLSNYEDYQTFFTLVVFLPAIAGEFSFTGWLLLRGGKVRAPRANPASPTLTESAFEDGS
jgi:hypothetical protein